MALITGTAAANFLIGTNVTDVIRGLGGDDALAGLNGDDILNGGSGLDLMVGGSGNDIYVVDNTGDRPVEGSGEGIDRVNSFVSFSLNTHAGVRSIENLRLVGSADINGVGNSLDNSINGNGGDNVLSGLGGSDALRGFAGDDDLRGGLGLDQLFGGLNNDILNGGSGSDVMTGGAGFDSFNFTNGLSAFNIDLITDFNHTADTIRLENGIFTGLATGTLSAASFRVGATAADVTDRIIYDNITGNLYFDPDGTGAAAQQQFATLAGSPDNVTRFDFVVI